MAFFSSPSLPKLPFPGDGFGLPRTAWAPGDSHPLSWGPQCLCGRFWDCSTSWVLSRRKLGEGPSGHATKGGGRVTHSSRPLLPSMVVVRKREEGRANVGWVGWEGQVEETGFICATAWSLQPVLPQARSYLGPKLQ